MENPLFFPKRDVEFKRALYYPLASPFSCINREIAVLFL
jgi:hypothetical protein